VLIDQLDTSELTQYPCLHAGRKGTAIPQFGGTYLFRKIFFYLQPHPLADQQAFDAIDVAGAFPLQAG